MREKDSLIKDYHNGIVKKSITINASKEKVWKKISNIIELEWLEGIKIVKSISSKKQGIGAIRELEFQDGSIIKEFIVGWKNNEYFSYIAVSGLPLRGYHATISLTTKNEKSIMVTWKSYFNSDKMTQKQFTEFYSFIGLFYVKSLNTLKTSLE
tara:strand:- start:745 stop:1206 length:462 start_codon:yes stop_codon:yes gene_type:complete